jgi:MATE family multidrug resistance protein
MLSDDLKAIKQVLKLSWPVMLSMCSYTMMAASDAIFVGRLGTAPLAAIGLAVTTNFLFLGLPIGLVRGLRVATAQATGARRHRSVLALGWQALWLALAGGMLVVLISFGSPAIFHWLGAGPEVAAEAQAYFGIRVAAAPLALYLHGFSGWFDARGETRASMRVNVATNLISVALCAVFVPGWGPIPAMGIRGAAWSGVIALAVGSIALFRVGWPTLRAVSWRPRRVLIAESIRLGLPIGVQRVLDVGTWTVIAGVLASIGEAQLAAHVLAIRILMVTFLPGLAVAEGTAVLVGQAVGARDPEGAKRAWRAGTITALGIMLVGAVAFVVAPDLLLGPFGAGREVLPIARDLLLIAAAFQVLDAVATVTYFSLDGAGDTRFTLVSSIVMAWGVKLPIGVALARWAGMGAPGVWLGLTGELLLLMLVLLWRWRSERWFDRAAEPALAK